MMQFRYLAVSVSGKKCRGKLSAESSRAARAQLLEQQLTLISITSATDSPRAFSLSLGRAQDNIRGSELALLTRQLSTLVAAALPLEEALQALAQQSEKPRHRALLQQVRNKILEGQSLADALASFPKTFNTLFRTMIAAGEASGHLDKVLLRLADNAEQSQKLKSKMQQALIYPLVLTVVAVAVVAILLTAVVPKVVEQFIHMQQALPLSTRLLITFSDALREFGLWVVLACLTSAVGMRQWLKSAKNQLWWHKKNAGFTLDRSRRAGSQSRPLCPNPKHPQRQCCPSFRSHAHQCVGFGQSLRSPTINRGQRQSARRQPSGISFGIHRSLIPNDAPYDHLGRKQWRTRQHARTGRRHSGKRLRQPYHHRISAV